MSRIAKKKKTLSRLPKTFHFLTQIPLGNRKKQNLYPQTLFKSQHLTAKLHKAFPICILGMQEGKHIIKKCLKYVTIMLWQLRMNTSTQYKPVLRWVNKIQCLLIVSQICHNNIVATVVEYFYSVQTNSLSWKRKNKK